MYILIAAVALLGFLSAAHAQDRRFSALSNFAAGPQADRAPDTVAPTSSHADHVTTDGFTGSFSARQTAVNRGY